MHALLILGLLLAAAPNQSVASSSFDDPVARCYRNTGGGVTACDEALAKKPAVPQQGYLLMAKTMILAGKSEYTVASAVMREALNASPKDAQRHLVYAWVLEGADNPQAANAEYRQALKLGLVNDGEIQISDTTMLVIANVGGAGNFYYTVGQAFERNRQKTAAKAFYLQAAADFAKRPDPKVIDAYNDAIRMDPGDATIHERFAQFWAHYDEDHGAQVVQQLEEAVKLAPENAAYHYALGQAYESVGNAAQSVVQYRETARLKPDDSKAMHDLQVAMLGSGEVGVAAAETPDTPEALVQLRGCVDRNGLRGEIACRSALKIGLSAHNASMAHTFLGEELSGTAAIDEYHEAIKSDPNNALAYYFLARRLAAQPAATDAVQPEDSAVLFDSANKLRPDWVAPRRDLASLLWSRKKHADAIAIEREAINVDPADDSLAAKLKEWQTEFAADQDELKAVAAELQAHPNDAALHQRFATALASTGRADEARNEYRAAYKLDPKDGWAMASTIMYSGFADVACDIYAETRPKDAPELPQSALEQDLSACAHSFPQQTRFLAQLAVLQFQRRDNAAAQRSYQAILNIDPEYFDKHPQEREIYDRSRQSKGVK